MIAWRLLVVLAVLLLAMGASGCRKVVSEQVLEATGEDLLFSIAGSEVEVDCPSGITMRAQEDFFCRTSIADRRGYLLVRQLDDYGRVEFQRELPLDDALVERLVERFLRRQFEIADAEVSCPDEVIQEPDENFTCRVKGRPDVRVRQVDGVDEYSFRYLGASATGGIR